MMLLRVQKGADEARRQKKKILNVRGLCEA